MDIKDIQDKSKRYRSNKESHSLHKLSKLKEPHRLLQYLCENMSYNYEKEFNSLFFGLHCPIFRTACIFLILS